MINRIANHPEPIRTLVIRDHTRDGWTTTIARLWHPWDVPRCQLCPSCSASPEGMCVVMCPEEVPDEQVPLYSLNGREVE